MNPWKKNLKGHGNLHLDKEKPRIPNKITGQMKTLKSDRA